MSGLIPLIRPPALATMQQHFTETFLGKQMISLKYICIYLHQFCGHVSKIINKLKQKRTSERINDMRINWKLWNANNEFIIIHISSLKEKKKNLFFISETFRQMNWTGFCLKLKLCYAGYVLELNRQIPDFSRRKEWKKGQTMI